ncbi:MAG: hypothetical protein PHX83_10115 [Acidobacteriia bacterium]|nr:hypothetical protein [Terriglobia bacterium]
MRDEAWRTTRGTGFVLGVLMLFGLSQLALGQPYISTRGGLVNTISGRADVHGARDLRWEKARQLLQLHDGDELRVAENSYVELLLNPGSYARLGGDSLVRMNNTGLMSLDLNLRRGSMEIEATNLKSVKRIRVSLNNRDFYIVKDGIYRFDVDPSGASGARVFKGEMQTMASNGHMKNLKKSAEADIEANGTVAFTKFDTHMMDSLSEWSAGRANQLARANARAMRSYMNNFSMYSPYYWPAGYFGMWGGGWFYDPFFGGYTFFPGYWFNSFYGPNFFGPPVIIVQQPNGTRRVESTNRGHETLFGNSGGGSKDSGGWSSFGGGGHGGESHPSSAPAPSMGGSFGGSMGRSESAGPRESVSRE